MRPMFFVSNLTSILSYQKLPSMSFQDNLEKVRDLYVVSSFISIREITLYFSVHFKNMEHYFIYFFFFFALHLRA